MKIDVNTVIQQLRSENSELNESMQYTYEIDPDNMSGNTDGLDTVSSMYPESKAVIDEMMSKIENN